MYIPTLAHVCVANTCTDTSSHLNTRRKFFARLVADGWVGLQLWLCILQNYYTPLIYIWPMRALHPPPPPFTPPPPWGLWGASAYLLWPSRHEEDAKWKCLEPHMSCVARREGPLADRCLQAREMLATARFARQTARCARRGGQPPHPPKITRLLHCYRPPFVCTALCMYRLVCAPPVLLCIRLAALDAGASPRTPLK